MAAATTIRLPLELRARLEVLPREPLRQWVLAVPFPTYKNFKAAVPRSVTSAGRAREA